MNVLRLLKVLFASYAAAICIVILGIVLGALIFGFSQVDQVIKGYLIPLVLVCTIILVPVMYKKLK